MVHAPAAQIGTRVTARARPALPRMRKHNNTQSTLRLSTQTVRALVDADLTIPAGAYVATFSCYGSCGASCWPTCAAGADCHPR